MRRLLLMLVLGGCETFFPLDFDAGGDGASSDAEVPCPPDYDVLSIQGNRYRLVLDPVLEKNWVDAEADCRATAPDITHLAVPDNSGELGFLRVRLAVTGDTAWIGVGRDASVVDPQDKTAFRNVTGGPSIDAWEPNEPSAGDPEMERVVTISKDDNFRDTRLSEPHAYICECDGNKVVPFDWE